MNQHFAEIAATLAKQNYHGNTDAAISNLQELCDLFADTGSVTLEELNTDWSGAFAYLCANKAGFGLPLRYPDPRVHSAFDKVSAWVEYARLPKINLLRSPATEPEVGDLVVFDRREGKPDRIGVVLAVYEDTLEVALGNHHNHSAVIECPRGEGIFGYIKLKEE